MSARRRLLAAFLLCGCGWKGVEGDADGVRIMPLGDSITQGDYARESYRRPLWHLLKRAGFRVDFVGSMRRNYIAGPFQRDFDLDHEGHWGWTIDEVLEHLPAWAAAARPDAVLIHLGSNDLFRGEEPEQVARELERVIDILRQANPRVALFIAELIPAAGMEAEFAAANEQIRQLQSLGTAESPVFNVDMFTGFDPELHTYDGVHPNEAGEQVLAERWYEALRGWLGERAKETPPK